MCIYLYIYIANCLLFMLCVCCCWYFGRYSQRVPSALWLAYGLQSVLMSSDCESQSEALKSKNHG